MPPSMNDTASAPTEKKTCQIIRLSSCAEWRKSKETSLATDVPYKVDAFLTGLDWKKVAQYEAPVTIRSPKEKDSSIQLVLGHVERIARDTYGIYPKKTRDRLANTLCYIANAIFESCNVLVKGLQKTRIMPYHVDHVCMLTDCIVGGFEYIGVPLINTVEDTEETSASTSTSNGVKRDRPTGLDNAPAATTTKKSKAKGNATAAAPKAKAKAKTSKKTTTKTITSSKVAKASA